MIAYKQRVNRAASLVAAAALALASGCSSLPPIDTSSTGYLETDFTGLGGLEVDVDGNPDTRPGALAAEGFVASVEACDIFFWACALIMVPAGAATGGNGRDDSRTIRRARRVDRPRGCWRRTAYGGAQSN